MPKKFKVTFEGNVTEKIAEIATKEAKAQLKKDPSLSHSTAVIKPSDTERYDVKFRRTLEGVHFYNSVLTNPKED